jgi:flagellin
MAAVLNSNIASLYASKNLQNAQSKMANSVERLSSGLRINRAKDDAAGLGIANALTQQINGANQGVRNLNDGISMVQTAEGGISAAQEMAQRILTLATQGANGTMGTTDRTAIKSEMTQLLSAINSIGSRTKFSGNSLLNFNPHATAVTNQFSLQASNVTTDVVALSSNAFKSIGGFSSSASMAVADTKTYASGGASGQANIVLDSKTDLAVNMGVSGTGIPAGTYITAIAGGSNTITLSNNLTAQAAGELNFYVRGTTGTSTPSTLTLATGSNPPSNLVGTSVYKVSSAGSYEAISTVSAVSGDSITLASVTPAVTWNYGDAIVFSGQLTEILSATDSDLSLAQSIGSTSNDTSNFQMVQRAAAGYVTSLSTQRSLLGAYQNQIEYTVSNVNELASNLSAARSNVQDTDYASETASLTKGQILQQAATAMLAQANQMPNVILSLLK